MTSLFLVHLGDLPASPAGRSLSFFCEDPHNNRRILHDQQRHKIKKREMQHSRDAFAVLVIQFSDCKQENDVKKVIIGGISDRKDSKL